MLTRSYRITGGLLGTVIIALAILAFLFTVGGETRCAHAQASCNVGDDETFAGDLVLQSGTAFDLTQGHSITANRAVTWPDAAGVVVLDTDTQTVTSKTFTTSTYVSPTITTSPTAAGATWVDLGAVTTADINAGTVDAVIGGTTPAAGTFTTLTTTGAVTIGGDTDLQNNDLNNIGDAGTDFTSSAVSIAQPVTLGDTLTHDNLSRVEAIHVDGTTQLGGIPSGGSNDPGTVYRKFVRAVTSGSGGGAFNVIEWTVPNNGLHWIIEVKATTGKYGGNSTNYHEYRVFEVVRLIGSNVVLATVTGVGEYGMNSANAGGSNAGGTLSLAIARTGAEGSTSPQQIAITGNQAAFEISTIIIEIWGVATPEAAYPPDAD